MGGPAQCDVVEDRRVAADHPGLLEAVHPALDRRRAERDPRADVLERAPGVLAQQRNDLLVDFVQFHREYPRVRNDLVL